MQTSGVRNPELGVARYSINLCELSFATALVASAVDRNDNWTKPVQPSTRLSFTSHCFCSTRGSNTALSSFFQTGQMNPMTQLYYKKVSQTRS